MAYDIVGTDIKHDAISSVGKDNCPTLANGPTIPGRGDIQTNTDLDTLTQLGGGDLFGNVCDSDDDNDSMADAAEPTNAWNGTGCTNKASDTPAATDPLDADIGR